MDREPAAGQRVRAVPDSVSSWFSSSSRCCSGTSAPAPLSGLVSRKAPVSREQLLLGSERRPGRPMPRRAAWEDLWMRHLSLAPLAGAATPGDR